MSLYTKSASETPFSKLPPELSTVIFDLATVNCRPNAANCRLVCQDFHVLSSPFLIRTIVIAERFDALGKAREILLHPYFSKHVTHLLWDASHYQESIATNYYTYHAAFIESTHTFEGEDQSYCQKRAADAVLQKQLRCIGPAAPSIPLQLRGNGSLLEYNVAGSANDRCGRSNEQHDSGDEPGGEDDISDEPHPQLPQCSQVPLAVTLEDGFSRECHLSFSDYYRGWINQQSIRGRDQAQEDIASHEDPDYVQSKELENIELGVWDIDGNLAQHYFRRAIDELPNLRHLMYGDHRALAYDGESHAELCRRLFGKTVCPSCSLTERDSLRRFNEFVYDLQVCGRDWKSLSVGRHPFETPYADRLSESSRDAAAPYPQDDVTMKWETLTLATRDKDDTKLQIKTLRLPVMRTNLHITEVMGGLSTFVGQGLIHLDLGVITFSRFLTQPAEMWDKYDTLAPLLNPLLSGFESLQTLTLRGVVFEVAEMQKFLLGLATTLRTLRLVDCYCPDDYDAFLASVKDSIAPATTLAGVEIYGLRFRNAMRVTDSRTLRSEAREHRAMRASRSVWSAEALATKGRHLGGDALSCWPYERQELEAAMLGGSVNRVTRRFVPPSAGEIHRWCDVPITHKFSYE
jgi:hypothetical protein